MPDERQPTTEVQPAIDVYRQVGRQIQSLRPVVVHVQPRLIEAEHPNARDMLIGQEQRDSEGKAHAGNRSGQHHPRRQTTRIQQRLPLPRDFHQWPRDLIANVNF